MDHTAKASINLKEGTIELQGTEAFVSKYLDDFKVHLQPVVHVHDLDEIEEKRNPGKQSSVSKNGDSLNIGKAKNSLTSKKTTKAKKTKLEQFDIAKGNDKPSLEDFIKEKKPNGSAAEYIAVIGYYITYYCKQEHFTEGNVEFAYRALNLGKPPLNIRQSFIDAKNKKFYVDPVEVEGVEGAWEMQVIGNRFVEYDLPKA